MLTAHLFKLILKRIKTVSEGGKNMVDYISCNISGVLGSRNRFVGDVLALHSYITN